MLQIGRSHEDGGDVVAVEQRQELSRGEAENMGKETKQGRVAIERPRRERKVYKGRQSGFKASREWRVWSEVAERRSAEAARNGQAPE